MILIPIIALVIGVFLGMLWNQPITDDLGKYLAIVCLAGLDTICGGIRSGLEGKFAPDVFITGFFSNIAIAFGLSWLGDKIYVDLFLAVALVLGARTFTNLSLIRRYLLTRGKDAMERRRVKALAAKAASGQSGGNLGQADTAA